MTNNLLQAPSAPFAKLEGGFFWEFSSGLGAPSPIAGVAFYQRYSLFESPEKNFENMERGYDPRIIA